VIEGRRRRNAPKLTRVASPAKQVSSIFFISRSEKMGHPCSQHYEQRGSMVCAIRKDVLFLVDIGADSPEQILAAGMLTCWKPPPAREDRMASWVPVTPRGL
jgi:hypothetical protein